MEEFAMNRTLFVALAAVALAGGAHAASLTVLGTGGGKIIYDNQDVGTVPLRLTKVPDGTHTVKVTTPAGEKTFTLSYPSAGDHVIDMDRELNVAAVARVSREEEERIRRDERRRLEREGRYRYNRYDPYGPYGGGYGAYPYGYGGYPYGYGYPYGGGGIGFGFGSGFGRRGFRRGGIGFGIGF
jgi:hypothetical protein